MNNIKISELLGLGSAATFILTIVYLYGYSTALGVNLFLYFGLNDYFRLAIEWLSPVIGLGIAGALVDRFFKRIEHGATEAEIVARSPNPKFTRRFRRSEVAIVVVLVLGAILNIVLSYFGFAQADYMLRGFAGAFLWFAAIAWYGKEPKLIRNWTPPWKIFVIMLPPLLIVAFSYGLYSGKTGTHPYIRPADVQISLKGETTPISGRILFLLDEYLVLREEQGGIAAIPKAEVTKIAHSQDK